jgi:hypothetical protein
LVGRCLTYTGTSVVLLLVEIGRAFIPRKALQLRTSVVAAMLLSVAAAAQTDVHEMVQRSVQVITADWKAAPEYECFERDREPNGSSKTFQDLMIMGSPYQRLVAINDKPLSRHEQEDQQRRLEETIEQRRNESAQQRTKRIADYEKSRNRDHLFVEQLAKAFNFSLVGEEKLGSYEVYELQAVPRIEYQPPNREAEVLKGMRGRLWIDKKTYQWIKVEARVIRPVWIEGFVAKVEPGTQFELEKMPVGDDIWLPKHYEMKARARVLFLFSHRSGENVSYYDYRKIAPSPGISSYK